MQCKSTLSSFTRLHAYVVVIILVLSACSTDESAINRSSANTNEENTLSNSSNGDQQNNAQTDGSALTRETGYRSTRGPEAMTITSHARVQQQFLSSPSIVNYIALGQSYDFSNPNAIALRKLLTQTKVTYERQFPSADGIGSIGFTVEQVYCPGGKFVMVKTATDGAFNINASSASNSVIQGETTVERFEGVWDTAFITGTDNNGNYFGHLQIINMLDFSEVLQQQENPPQFPQPGQNDAVLGTFLLTTERQALAPNATFWVVVQGAYQNGVRVKGQSQIAQSQPAQNLCG